MRRPWRLRQTLRVTPLVLSMPLTSGRPIRSHDRSIEAIDAINASDSMEAFERLGRSGLKAIGRSARSMLLVCSMRARRSDVRSDRGG